MVTDIYIIRTPIFYFHKQKEKIFEIQNCCREDYKLSKLMYCSDTSSRFLVLLLYLPFDLFTKFGDAYGTGGTKTIYDTL